MRNEIERYLQERSLRLSPRTLEVYRYELERLVDVAITNGQTSWISIDRDLLVRHLQTSAKHLAQASVCKLYYVYTAFFDYLAARKRIAVNPMADMERPKLSRRLPAFLALTELDRLIETLPYPETCRTLSDFHQVRTRFLVELFYSTGCRLSEIQGMNIDDVDRHANRIRVIGKGDKERMVPLGSKAAQVLAVWMTVRADRAAPAEPALIIGANGRRLDDSMIHRIIAKAGRMAELKQPLHAHVFRHTCATHLLRGKMNLRAIQMLLGHGSIATTERYTHVTDADIRDGFQTAHPRA